VISIEAHPGARHAGVICHLKRARSGVALHSVFGALLSASSCRNHSYDDMVLCLSGLRHMFACLSFLYRHISLDLSVNGDCSKAEHANPCKTLGQSCVQLQEHFNL
jgi:hypothetical protein